MKGIEFIPLKKSEAATIFATSSILVSFDLEKNRYVLNMKEKSLMELSTMGYATIAKAKASSSWPYRMIESDEKELESNTFYRVI